MNKNVKHIMELLDNGQYREYPESDFSDLKSLKLRGLINIIEGELSSNPILHVSLTSLGRRAIRQLKTF